MPRRHPNGAPRPAAYAIITENLGKTTIYGADADLTYLPLSADRLNVLRSPRTYDVRAGYRF